jgi:uncharacterized membrane protein
MNANNWFLLIAFPFGVLAIFLTPPLQVPDEHTHFHRAYDVSRGHLIARAPVVLPKTVAALQAQYPPRLEIAWGEYRTLTLDDLLHALREPLRPDDTVSWPSGHIYTFVPYLPSAFGILIARHLGASALGLLYAGRLMNLLVYAALIYWALLKLPGLHLPFLLVAAMPMSLQQAASLSADSLTISATLLYIALILSLSFEDDKRLTAREYGLILLLAIIVVMAKANVALVLLPLAIPARRFGGMKRKLLLVAALSLVAYLPFAIWQYVNRENIEAFRTASLQAGVDISANLAFLRDNPGAFLKVLGRTLLQHSKDYTAGMVGLVGWNAARLPSWVVWFYLTVIAVISISEPRSPWLTAKQRLLFIAIFTISALSVFMALWSLETQTSYIQKALVDSSTTIANVQGRYFITILALAVVVISTRVPWPISWRAGRWISAGSVVIAGVAFWVVACQAYYAGSTRNPNESATLAKISHAGIFLGGFSLLQAEDSNSTGCRSFHFLSSHLDTVPLLGDWNGDGRTKVGMYKKGSFYLDYNGNGRPDKVYPFVAAQAGDVPLVGDWNGDGRTKVGIFRSGFLWILDYNGNGKLDQEGDRVFGLGGIPMDLPVVGDWNGDGRSKAGIYRHGVWLLQSEDSVTNSVKFITRRFGYELMEEGRDCDIPVVGDWNGDRKTKIGMLLVHDRGAGARTYQWALDRNGNGIFDDAVFDLGGAAGDVPLVWNQGRPQPTAVGVYRSGSWMVSDGSAVKSWRFGGLPRDIVVAGDWSGEGKNKPGVLRDGASWVLEGSTISFGNW